MLKTPTPAEAGALRKKLAGRYISSTPDQLPRLEITADRITASGGPVTVTYTYEPSAHAGEQVRLILSAPDSEPETITLLIEGSTLTIAGSPFLEGQWKKR